MNHLFITYEIQDVLGYQSAHLLFQFLCIQIVHKHSLGSCKVPKVPHKIQAHQFSRSDVYWTSKDKTSKVYRDVDILNPKNISIYIIHIKCSLNLSYQKKNFQKNCNILVFFSIQGKQVFFVGFQINFLSILVQIINVKTIEVVNRGAGG